MSQKFVRNFVLKAVRRANLGDGSVHVLRYSFLSRVAMRGAPARAIQDLARHQDLRTTERYMDLTPGAVEGAVRLLERDAAVSTSGDILETGSGQVRKAKERK